MQDMQDMMRRLNQSGKRLSKGHRKIAEYIVEHYDKAVFMTASKLGEKVGVSESTVVRFASAMGYEGYPQLQRALQELVRHWLTAVQRFEMATDIDQSEVLRTVLHADMQNIRTTTEEIDTAAFDEVVDKIIGARNIYVMGLRSAAPIAQFLAYYLNFIFDNVRVVSEASGAQVIGLTDGPMSPVYATSTVCLTARTDMASFVDSMAAPLSVINALIVALGLRRKDELSEHFRLMEGIWDEYRVYVGKDRV